MAGFTGTRRDKVMNGSRISTATIVLIIVAALVGFFFGFAIQAQIGDMVINGGPLWGVVFAIISAVLAYVVSIRTDISEVEVEENGLSHFLFKNPRSSVIWLPIRIFVGLDWLSAGLHKLSDPKWMNGGVALQGFWKSAVAVP